MKKYIFEGIGTFFLVLTVAYTGNPLAIGAVLAVLVYMGGAVSGGHYNPAVSLALWKVKKLSSTDLWRYIGSQLLGSFLAVLLYGFLTGKSFMVAPATDTSFIHALIAEIIFTFLLVTVVLQTAVSDKTKGNSYFGLAIGFSVMVGAFAVGNISGGAFNPAVGLSPLVVNIANGINLNSFALYSIGPIVGSLLASWLYLLP